MYSKDNIAAKLDETATLCIANLVKTKSNLAVIDLLLDGTNKKERGIKMCKTNFLIDNKLEISFYKALYENLKYNQTLNRFFCNCYHKGIGCTFYTFLQF